MPKRTRDHHAWLLTQLADPRIAANYINEGLDDSPAMFLKALRNVAEARTMAKVAQGAGVNRESLYRSLSEEGNPRLSTLNSVLTVLGLKIVVEPEQGEAMASPAPTAQNEPICDDTGSSFKSAATLTSHIMILSGAPALTAENVSLARGARMHVPWYLLEEENTGNSIRLHS